MDLTEKTVKKISPQKKASAVRKREKQGKKPAGRPAERQSRQNR